MSNRKMHDDWQACPPGTLSRLAVHERQLQRRNFLLRVGGVSGLAGMGVMGAWLLAQRGNLPRESGLPIENGFPGEETYGGIQCSKVKELAPSFLKRQLSQSLVEQIEVHLESCISCKNFVETLSDSNNHEDV